MHHHHVTDWDVAWPEYTPKQNDAVSCGIFVIENALEVAMGEDDCEMINHAEWQIWLATEAIEKGRRDLTHPQDNILPAPPGMWETCLGRHG